MKIKPMPLPRGELHKYAALANDGKADDQGPDGEYIFRVGRQIITIILEPTLSGTLRRM